MITVKGLTKRYARTVAVDNISFEIPKGQIVGFLGPNGAGKTTTMRVLTCFLPPSAGSANVAGFDVLEQPLEVKKRIGYLPETPPLYPDMTVGDYLEFVGKLKGLAGSDLKRRIGEVCERCNVADVREKIIGKLSKGYRQRVGLAQAIIHNPDVLILDEPTSGLDPNQIIQTRKMIEDLAAEHTIILSTHILPEVEQTCKLVMIIAKGKLVATDTVENLRHRTRGAHSVIVEVEGRDAGAIESTHIQQQLEKVAGVSRVIFKETRGASCIFEVESLKDRAIRGDLARSIVEAGWNLNELRSAAMSLEEVFLQLTGADTAAAAQLAEGIEK